MNNFISQKQSEFDLFKQFKLEEFYLADAESFISGNFPFMEKLSAASVASFSFSFY